MIKLKDNSLGDEGTNEEEEEENINDLNEYEKADKEEEEEEEAVYCGLRAQDLQVRNSVTELEGFTNLCITN